MLFKKNLNIDQKVIFKDFFTFWISEEDVERIALYEHKPRERAIDEIFAVLNLRDVSVKFLTSRLYKIGCNKALEMLIHDKSFHITLNLDESCIELIEGDSYQLEIRAIGVPVPEYQWLKDGKEILNQNNNFLKFKSLR